MRPTLLLTSLTGSTNLFETCVRRGIDRREFTDSALPSHTDPVRCLPVPNTAGVDVQQVVGDWIICTTDGAEYSWVAKVRDVRTAPEIDFTPSETDTDFDAEFTDTILLLSVPIPIAIDRRQLQEMIESTELPVFHRLTQAEHTAIENDYGSVARFLLAHRAEPRVWIDTQAADKLEAGAGSSTAELQIPNETDGAGPQIGDIVLHLSESDSTITGTSVIASTPQYASSDAEQDHAGTDGDAALVHVAEYQPLSRPIHLFDDILDEPTYSTRLNQIADEYDSVPYDDNRDLIDGVEFTLCPPPLLNLVIAATSELIDQFKTWHFQVQRPAPTDAYNSVEAALVDIRIRLAFSDHGPDWFADETVATIVSELSETLPEIQSDSDISPNAEVHCDLLRQLFEQTESQLTAVVSRLGIGAVQPLTETQTLFFVLFNELQRRSGVSQQVKPVNVRAILEKEYTVTTPRRPTTSPKGQPLDTASKPDQADDVARQLTTTGQVVFYGPPGTGKTYTAAQFARWWLHQQSGIDPTTDQIETVTFHPSFTYEDFIEGLKADNTDKGVVYDYKPGIFKQFVESAREAYRTATDTPPRYVMIIDEINRGNLAQIFGETITGLEYDKRLDAENETTVSLAHSGRQFTIPPNLFLIGTMNTADRSIALVDAALRRRFRFVSFPPNFDAIVDHPSTPFTSFDEIHSAAETPGHANRLYALSILTVMNFNQKILTAADLGKGKQIGHSFFFGKTTGPELVDTWRYEILPLLEEYFFGQFERIRDSLFDGGGHRLINYDAEELRTFDAATLTAELATLLDVDE